MKSSTLHRSLVFFGFGQLTRSVMWCATDMLIAFHLVERVGFSGHAAGAIMFATFALSALPDIFVANWIAARSCPAQAALRLQYIFGLVAAATAVLLFCPPPGGWYEKVAYVCAASIAFRTSYAIYDVSQNALLSLLPRTSVEVQRYVTSKTMASSIGRLLASLLVAWALARSMNPLADAQVMTLIALPVIVTCFGLARVKVLPEAEQEAPQRFRWSSLPFRRLAMPVTAIAFQVACLGLISRLLPLFGHGETGYTDSATLVLAMVCGTVLGPALTHAAPLLIKKRPLAIATTLSCGATLTGIALVLPHDFAISVTLAFLYGVALSGITNLIWEQVALIATEHASATGVRIDAPAFALLTTTIKLAIAISTITFGLVLDGFRIGDRTSIATIMIVVAVGGIGTALTLLPSHRWMLASRTKQAAAAVVVR